jgi:hypothetical protein
MNSIEGSQTIPTFVDLKNTLIFGKLFVFLTF